MEFVRQAKMEGRIALSSNGSPTRAFCYVWDAIRQITSTLGRDEKQAVFNIGNGTEEIAILDLALAVAKACKLPDSTVSWNLTAHTEALQRCAPDVGRVTALVRDGSRFTPIETGLQTLVDWHQYLTCHG
jgi:dTDP-glucose 4,6-dehydratase/UDP-glucuronate decarboxylase